MPKSSSMLQQMVEQSQVAQQDMFLMELLLHIQEEKIQQMDKFQLLKRVDMNSLDGILK